MKNSFTFNDLFLYAYGESGGSEKEGLKDNPTQNEEQKTEDKKMKNRRMHAACFTITPDRRILNNIMNYSRALAVLRTEKSGNFNLLMN